jgi:tetratricopeptide (TPR) repeat protein
VSAVALSPDGQTALTATSATELLLWDISDLPNDLPRIECWVKVRTGLALDEEGQIKSVDDSAWQKERKQLAALGGTPENAETRWRLDPILFGPDPTARAKAGVARKSWTQAESAYDEVVAARPMDFKVLLERAQFLESHSTRDKAERDYAKANALGSRDPELIDSIVGSETLLRRMIGESPGAAAPLLARRAQMMLAQSRWQDAAAAFALELDLLPPDRYWISARSTRALEMARWEQAFESLLSLRPNDGHLWCVRGRYFALRNQWERAAADFARGIASAPPESEEWFEHACLRLIVGDNERYRAFIQEMRRREGQTRNPMVAYILARSRVQTTESGVEPAQVIRWAEFAVHEQSLPWYLSILGAAYYRAGQFEQAIQCLEKSNRAYVARKYGEDTDLANGLMLALAQMRLGRIPAARDSMRKFRLALKRVEDNKTDGAVSLSTTDWLPLQLLCCETDALILYDPVFPANPFAR